MLTDAEAASTQFALKLLATAVFATMFGMYSSTSVGGAGMELAVRVRVRVRVPYP